MYLGLADILTGIMYKAIGFDYGGVIFGKPATALGGAIQEALGIDRQTYLKAYHRHYKKPNRGEVTWEELWRLVITDLGKVDKLGEVLRIDADYHDNAIVNEPILHIADQLRAAGHKTGLLSNNSPDLQDAIKQNGVIKHFDVINISAITGLVKPEPEAFTRFASDLGVSLTELVFIDDSPNSLSTAGECGYTPVFFENVTQLAVELARLDLPVN